MNREISSGDIKLMDKIFKHKFESYLDNKSFSLSYYQKEFGIDQDKYYYLIENICETLKHHNLIKFKIYNSGKYSIFSYNKVECKEFFKNNSISELIKKKEKESKQKGEYTGNKGNIKYAASKKSGSESYGKKINSQNKIQTVVQIIGVIGVVATIIFGINQWKGRTDINTELPSKSDSVFQEKQDDKKRTIEVRDNGTYVEGNQMNVYNIEKNATDEIRKFQRNIPKSYLSQLPGIKENAYRDARKLWNTGITAEMMKGNYLVLDRLIDALADLAETAYTPDFFNGKGAKEYYSDKIQKMSKAAYDGQIGAEAGGTLGIVTGSNNLNRFVEDFIVEIVKDVSEPSYFISWKKEWDNAGKKVFKEEDKY